MAYTIYYGGCAEDQPDHIVDPCGTEREHGRVRSVAFIHDSYLATLLASPDNPTTWQTGILDKLIWILPQTAGTYDGGTPVYAPGYGDQKEVLAGYDHVVTYRDPDFKGNASFYNAIKQSRQWYLAINTETQTQIFESSATIAPKAPVQDDLTSEVVWEVEVRISQPDFPEPFDTPPGIFEAFNFN